MLIRRVEQETVRKLLQSWKLGLCVARILLMPSLQQNKKNPHQKHELTKGCPAHRFAAGQVKLPGTPDICELPDP